MIQTAEGALNETHAVLQRMRELAVQSATDTYTDADRAELQKEVDQLAKEISRISNDTEFNTQNLIGGNFSGVFHIGANQDQNIKLAIPPFDAYSLGVTDHVSETTATIAHGASHIESVTLNQSALGSLLVDGANITFDYDGSPATSAQITGTNEINPMNIGVGGGTTMVITVDGNPFTFNSSELNNLVGSETASDLANMINAKIGSAGTAHVDNNRIVITSASTGSTSSVDVGFTGSGAILVAPIFGFDTGGQSATGSDEVASSITVSNGNSVEDVVFNIADPNATIFSTGSDPSFGGLTIALGIGASLSDLAASSEAVSITADDEDSASHPASWDPVTGEMTKAIAHAGINISTQQAADSAITSIQEAIEIVSSMRSTLGAYQNRLEHSISNLSVSAENLTAAESRIRDSDMAKEMMKYTQKTVLSQASQAMLAQANQSPQGILLLLR